MKYAIVMLLKYSKDWLAMPREERNRFHESRLAPIFERYGARVGLRFFDAEAFCAEASDFALFEFQDPRDYYFLMEELRDTELFSKGWLEVKGITLGIEDGYRDFERESMGGEIQESGRRGHDRA
jgi:hypothetical protein